jgi:hypothetical protein
LAELLTTAASASVDFELVQHFMESVVNEQYLVHGYLPKAPFFLKTCFVRLG